jgi:hypothetical protein
MEYHNIGRSVFKRGEYVGYDKMGNPYRIRKESLGFWWVYPQTPDGLLPIFHAATLKCISERLANASR